MVEPILDLSKLSVGEKDSLIVRLFGELDALRGVVEDLQVRVASLEAENKELRGKLAKNSQNSSKPPSTDGYKKPKPKSLRKPSGKKPGGQLGHPPSRLEMVKKPDHIVPHTINACRKCGRSLKSVKVTDVHRRQVIDLPPIQLEVTEHHAETKHCPCCGCCNLANFPEAVKTSVQYGSRFKSLMIYLNQYQLLPSARSCELAKDLFSQTISQGTLYNWNMACFHNL